MASKGKKLQQSHRAATERLESGYYPIAAPEDKPRSGHTTTVFPVKTPNARSPHDEITRAKMQILQAGPQFGAQGVSQFGTVQASDADFETFRRAAQAEETANYTQWKLKNFYKNDVVSRAWFQEADPGIFESMEKEMVERAKMALRINLLLLRGPRNEQDLILQYGLESGQVQLDRDWNVIGPSGAMKANGGVDIATEQKRFAEGLFKMSAFRSYDQERNNAKGIARDGSQTYNPFAPTDDDFNKTRTFKLSQRTQSDSNEATIQKLMESLKGLAN